MLMEGFHLETNILSWRRREKSTTADSMIARFVGIFVLEDFKEGDLSEKYKRVQSFLREHDVANAASNSRRAKGKICKIM